MGRQQISNIIYSSDYYTTGNPPFTKILVEKHLPDKYCLKAYSYDLCCEAKSIDKLYKSVLVSEPFYVPKYHMLKFDIQLFKKLNIKLKMCV